MRKLKKLKIVFAALLVLAFSSAAFALSPEDALSARQGSPFYYVVGLDDLNGMLQRIFSPANIEMAASVAPPEEAQIVRLLASFVAQVPARSVALAFGASGAEGGDLPVFMQLAAQMPASVRPKLDRVADGTASGVEIVTLLLGDGGIMFAAGFMPEVRKAADGSAYYSFNDAVTFAAEDDLLLITLSPGDLAASLGALANRENRLLLKRRFGSPDFLQMRADMPGLLAFLEELGTENEKLADAPRPEDLAKLFKGPMDVEMDFSSKPGSFLISTAVNALEALADAERYKDLKPVEDGLFMAGGGKLLGVMSGPLNLRAEDLKVSPEAAKIWNRIVKELEKLDIAESDLEALLNGRASVAFGSDATILGRRAPGGYVALTGREGAAAKVLEKLMASEKFTQAVTAAPLKLDGWDELFAVDPSLVPVPLLFGRTKDTLFVGIVDSAALNKTPELPAEVSAMLEKPLFAGGAVDFAGIWGWLRQEAADVNSPLSALIPDEGARAILNDLMTSELSVPLVKLWSPTLEEAFMEFTKVDVPSEKRLLPRLINIVMAFPGLQPEAPYEEETEP